MTALRRRRQSSTLELFFTGLGCLLVWPVLMPAVLIWMSEPIHWRRFVTFTLIWVGAGMAVFL